MKNKVAAILTFALTLGLLAGCGQTMGGSSSSETTDAASGTTAEAAAESSGTGEGTTGASVTSLSIGTGPSGGNQEVIGAAVAEIWNNNVSGIQFTAVPTGGTSVNVILLDSGENQIVMSTADTSASAYNGVEPFDRTYENLAGLFCTYPNTLQMWASEKSGITCFADLKGKKFTFGQPGSGSYQPTLNMMELAGFTEEDKKNVQELGWGDAVSALSDGQIDAVIWTTSYPAAKIVDAQLTTEINLVQIEPELLSLYQETYGGWVDVLIEAGTYDRQDSDITTIGTYNTFVCAKDLDEDVVYNLVKAVWENREILGNTYAPLKDLTGEIFAGDIGIDPHPGALKYFKEQGWK